MGNLREIIIKMLKEWTLVDNLFFFTSQLPNIVIIID